MSPQLNFQLVNSNNAVYFSERMRMSFRLSFGVFGLKTLTRQNPGFLRFHRNPIAACVR